MQYNLTFQQFGGVLIALESLPDWIGWLQCVSFLRYAVEVTVLASCNMKMFTSRVIGKVQKQTVADFLCNTN